MQISSNMGVVQSTQTSTAMKTSFTQALTKDEASELRAKIVENANAFAFKSSNIQTNLANPSDDFTQNYEDFQSFLKDVGYKGKPIAELSKEEATELISEDGLFGIKQTSERIANFVISGAGSDEERMRAGREGMLQGFKMAEEMWGGKLPEISQKTMEKAIELVDKAMSDLGFSLLDKEA